MYRGQPRQGRERKSIWLDKKFIRPIPQTDIIIIDAWIDVKIDGQKNTTVHFTSSYLDARTQGKKKTGNSFTFQTGNDQNTPRIQKEESYGEGGREREPAQFESFPRLFLFCSLHTSGDTKRTEKIEKETTQQTYARFLTSRQSLQPFPIFFY